MAQEKLPEFRLCACGLHGRIVCSDGLMEIEVFTTGMARKSLASAVERERVEARHVERLARRIAASGLTPDYDAVPPGLMTAVCDWNNRGVGPLLRNAPPCFRGIGT